MDASNEDDRPDSAGSDREADGSWSSDDGTGDVDRSPSEMWGHHGVSPFRAVAWIVGASLLVVGLLSIANAPMRATTYLVLGVLLIPRTRGECKDLCRVWLGIDEVNGSNHEAMR